MSTGWADHFSGIADDYATYRPRYPDALFDALCDVAPSHALAWDCGTGSGQAALALAHRFASVVATDASAAQLEHATPHARVTYRTAPADASALAEQSVALITVAQALHWFDVDAFHAEAQRVLMPDGVIAEWSYGLLHVPAAPAVAALVTALDLEVRDFWPPERLHVDDAYARLPFPFAPVDVGTFTMDAMWGPPQLLGYLSTWSAVTRCRAQTGVDPLQPFADSLEQAWGRAPMYRMEWPLALRVGRHAIAKADVLARSVP